MPSSQQNANSHLLTGFDGMRAIACLWVIVFHLSQKLNPAQLASSVQELQSVILLGNIGVSIFFVLSGALLSYPFWRNWLSGKEAPSLRGYAIKRFARIAPGFYLAMFVSLVLSIVVFGNTLDGQLLTRFLAGMTFVSSFHWVTFFPVEVNGPLWSIGFEVFAYVLLALFMVAMFRLVKTRTLATAMFYWLGVAMLCIGIHLLITHYLVPSDEGRGWQYGMVGGAKSWMPWYNPIGLFNHFLLGIFAAGFLSYLLRIQIKKAWYFDAIVLIVLASISLYLISYRHSYTGFNGELDNIYFWPWFPLAIAMSLCFLPFTQFMGKVLDNRFMRYVAKISFGLYIWHAIIIEVLHVTLFPDFGYMTVKTLSDWLMPAALSIGLSFIVAAASYKYVEHPVLAWGHKRAAELPNKPSLKNSADSIPVATAEVRGR